MTALCNATAPAGPRITFYNNVNHGVLSIQWSDDGTDVTPSAVQGYQDLDFNSGNSDSASLGQATGAGHTVDSAGNDHGTFQYWNSATDTEVSGFFLVGHNVGATPPGLRNCVTSVVII